MKFFPLSVAVSLGAAIAPPGKKLKKLTSQNKFQNLPSQSLYYNEDLKVLKTWNGIFFFRLRQYSIFLYGLFSVAICTVITMEQK
jgi:hypothetical protein